MKIQRTARRHQAATDPVLYWEFMPGDRVMVVEGFLGTVVSVDDGFGAGTEQYLVELDAGMGGGEYGSGELTAVEGTTAKVANETNPSAYDQQPPVPSAEENEEMDPMPQMPQMDQEVPPPASSNQYLDQNPYMAVASDDYPELAEILTERPPLPHSERLGAYDPATGQFSGDFDGGFPPCPRCGTDGLSVTQWGSAIQCGNCGWSEGTLASKTAAGDDGWYKSAVSSGDAFGRITGKNHYWKDDLPICGAKSRGGVPPKRGEKISINYNYCGACNKKAPEWQRLGSVDNSVPVRIRRAAGYIVEDEDGLVVAGPFVSRLDAEAAERAAREEGQSNLVITRQGMAKAETKPFKDSWWLERFLVPLADDMIARQPEHLRYDPATGKGPSYDWCRFRRTRRCFYPRELNDAATKEAGYAVWVPEDRGFCPRDPWEGELGQMSCPVSEPGPNAKPPHRPLADATISWENGGQRYDSNGNPLRRAASLEKTADRWVDDGLVWQDGPYGDKIIGEIHSTGQTFKVVMTGLSVAKGVKSLEEAEKIALAWSPEPGDDTLDRILNPRLGVGKTAADEDGWYESGTRTMRGQITGKPHYWRDGRPICKGSARSHGKPLREGWYGSYCSACEKKLTQERRTGSRVDVFRADPEFAFHLTATWKDVQAKAKRIHNDGHVRVISSSPAYLVGEVRGDTDIYQTTLAREGTSKRIAMWECGCAWASYSWGRSGRWKKYEGRMCSHAMALNYEGQSRGWGGQEITEDTTLPQWRSDPSITVKVPGDYKRPEITNWRLDTASSKTAKTDIPLPPGKTPLPSNTVRVYHATNPDNLASIKSRGLTLATAQGQNYGEPGMIWFSTLTDYARPGETDRLLVEVALPWDEIVDKFSVVGGPDSSNMTPAKFMSGNRNLALPFDVKPSWILALHEPWHFYYREFLSTPKMHQDALTGFYDNFADDPIVGPALERIKREGAVKTASPEQAAKLAEAVARWLPGWKKKQEDLGYTTTKVSPVEVLTKILGRDAYWFQDSDVKPDDAAIVSQVQYIVSSGITPEELLRQAAELRAATQVDLKLAAIDEPPALQIARDLLADGLSLSQVFDSITAMGCLNSPTVLNYLAGPGPLRDQRPRAERLQESVEKMMAEVERGREKIEQAKESIPRVFTPEEIAQAERRLGNEEKKLQTLIDELERITGSKEAAVGRSGVPEVDAAIQAFLKEPLGDWTTDDTLIGNLTAAQTHGNCESITEQFVEFCGARGLKAYVTRTNLDELGYKITGDPHGEVLNDAGEIVMGHYTEHTIASIYPAGARFPVEVDFSASQYGYTDHPKVLSSLVKESEARDLGNGVTLLIYGDQIVILENGMRAGQITWESKQDKRAFSEDDDVWPQALGDSNGYYLEVDALFVDPEFRRKGYGTHLFNAFKEMAEKRYGPKGWTTGEFTGEGAAWWKAYSGENVTPSRRIDVKRMFEESLRTAQNDVFYSMDEVKEAFQTGGNETTALIQAETEKALRRRRGNGEVHVYRSGTIRPDEIQSVALQPGTAESHQMGGRDEGRYYLYAQQVLAWDEVVDEVTDSEVDVGEGELLVWGRDLKQTATGFYGSKTASLQSSLQALKGAFVQAAQEEYDSWDEPPHGGGICDEIAARMSSIISEHIENVSVLDGGQDGDDHAWLVVADHEEQVAWGVDIHPSHYETGGGYSWTKIPGVRFGANMVEIFDVDYGLMSDNQEFDEFYGSKKQADAFHRYGPHDPETGRGGRRGDLSGQDYWIEVEGVRWEVASSRSGHNRAIWKAWTGNAMLPDDDPGAYHFVVAFNRAELAQQIEEETKLIKGGSISKQAGMAEVKAWLHKAKKWADDNGYYLPGEDWKQYIAKVDEAMGGKWGWGVVQVTLGAALGLITQLPGAMELVNEAGPYLLQTLGGLEDGEAEAILHDEPEPALPSTTGEEEDEIEKTAALPTTMKDGRPATVFRIDSHRAYDGVKKALGEEPEEFFNFSVGYHLHLVPTDKVEAMMEKLPRYSRGSVRPVRRLTDPEGWLRTWGKEGAKMYHVAPASARSSIEEHGLDYSRGGKGAPVSGEGDVLPQANYLYRDRVSADDLFSNLSGHDLWEVETEGLSLEDDPYEDADAAMVMTSIPPTHLKRVSAGEGEIVPGDPRLAWIMKDTPAGKDGEKDEMNVADAARTYLAKTGVKNFTAEERRVLIEEGEMEGVVASNLDRLDIAGTHYEPLEEAYKAQDEEWWA